MRPDAIACSNSLPTSRAARWAVSRISSCGVATLDSPSAPAIASARSARAMADCVARGNSTFVDSMLSRICSMASAISCVVSTCSREARAICPIASSDSPDDSSIWLSEACTLSTLRAASVTPSASELMPRAAFSDCSLISRTITLISSEASLVRCANCRTSPATTAKPRPCSPARAASMAAFSASKLVRAEISEMASVKPVMRLDLSCKLSMVLEAPCASSRALLMRRSP